jgi:hypothetical protein
MQQFNSDKEKYEALKTRLRLRIRQIRRSWSQERNPANAGQTENAILQKKFSR